MSGLWCLMAVWNVVRLELLIDGACKREVLLQLNKDTVAKFCFMLTCYLWGTGVCQEIIISVRECHFGYVHTVSVWDWQAYLLTYVSQMWIVPFIQQHTEVNWMWYVSMTMFVFLFFFANLLISLKVHEKMHFIHAMIWNYTSFLCFWWGWAYNKKKQGDYDSITKKIKNNNWQENLKCLDMTYYYY